MWRRGMHELLVGKPERRRPLRPRLRWWILGWILEKQNGVVCTGLAWLRIETRRVLS
jgi:hypothetical protein